MIDTIEDHTVRGAVIHVEGDERVMPLIKADTSGGEITESYVDKIYQLTLKYEPIQVNNTTEYRGTVEVKKGVLSSRYSLDGVRNTL